MNNNSTYALLILVGFIIGFLCGKFYEEKQNRFVLEGPGWKLEGKDRNR